MKYLFKTLIIFLTTFLMLKFLLFLFDSGHNINYTTGNFKVNEQLTVKNNEYYFEVGHEKFKISFSVNENYNKAEKVISKIVYKKVDGYDCVLPIFKNGKILTDVMCLKDGIVTYGHDINDYKIKNYIKTLKKYKYDLSKYKDTASAVKLSNTQVLYEKNILDNNYLAAENYKGLNLFNGKQNYVKIFENDVYKKPISYFFDKYYIVADYTENYTFKIFHVINIINGQKVDIRSYDDISFDSYIEGAIGSDVYLFDKDAGVQYKISIKNETVEKFHGKDNLKTFNGKWEDMSLKEAMDGKLFNNYVPLKVKGYDMVYKIGNYYYFYQKENSYYKVYRSNKKDSIKTYLFKTTNANSVIYLKNSIYYQYDDTILYYNNFGSRRVLKNTEFEFNSDLSFGVYEK